MILTRRIPILPLKLLTYPIELQDLMTKVIIGRMEKLVSYN